MAPPPGHDREPERVGRAQRLLSLGALVAVAALTVGGYVRATDDAERSAERVAVALAAEAAASVTTNVSQAISALEGAAALVGADGAIDRSDFTAFGNGILGGSVTAVVLGVVVPGDQRTQFEENEGPIVVRRPGGSFGPAPSADEYFALVDLVSDDPTTQRADGLDYGAEPVRADTVRTARDEARTVLSEPTRLQAQNRDGFLAMHPLYRRGAPIDTLEARRDAFVGFVSIGYAGADVLAALEQQLPPGTGASVRDGDRELFRFGALDGATSSIEVAVPGRTWTISVQPASGADTALPRSILVGGGVTFAGLLLLFAVTGRYQGRLRRAYAAQRQAQRRSETIERLASRLSQSLSSSEVADTLLAHVPPFIGASAGAVLAPSLELPRVLDVLAAEGFPASGAPVANVDLRVPSAIADAFRSGEPFWAPSPLAWRDDPVLDSFAGVGHAAAVVPLQTDGTVVGALVLVHGEVRTFYEDERALLDAVSPLAARALLRARRYDTEHDAAVVLQRALLPGELPPLPDVTIAVRYLPAAGGPPVGGDFYDVFAIGDGRIGIVIGDVVGRGVRAAAAMGQLRAALRALASVVPEPEALLQAFEAHVPTIPDGLCATMVYAVLDPGAGRVVYVRAGHPPPLLLRAGADVTLLDGKVAPPLGVTGAPPPAAASVAVEPGDTLVLYTDGVIERRGEPVTTGLDRLRRSGAAAAGLGPDECCDRIVADLLSGRSHDDDAAVLAIRLEPAPAGTAPAGPPGRLAPSA